MGLVSSVGLGISLANKKKVIALDGDGSIFINLGSLVTIALEAPANFNLIILDNGVYGSTGYQETAISNFLQGHYLKTSSSMRIQKMTMQQLRTHFLFSLEQWLELTSTLRIRLHLTNSCRWSATHVEPVLKRWKKTIIRELSFHENCD